MVIFIFFEKIVAM